MPCFIFWFSFTGLADITELLILLLDIILILLEILIIPGFGIAGISGIGLIFYSFFKMLIGVYPSSEDYYSAYMGLSIGIITAFIVSVIIYKTFPKTKLYQRFIPFKPQKSAEGFTISKGYEKLKGSRGKTVTDLRPSGKVEIGGDIYQAMSHGNYIENDEQIVVDSVEENQLQVTKVS